MKIVSQNNFIDCTFSEHHYSGFFVPAFGHHLTAPKHTHSTTRNYFLLHFIVSGKGKYYVDDKTYSLGAGHGFIIEPSVPTKYSADELDPWEYYWISFKGIDAISFMEAAGLKNKHYFTFSNEDIKSLVSLVDELKNNEHNLSSDYMVFKSNSVLLEILSRFVKNNSLQPSTKKRNNMTPFVDEALLYLNKNYNTDINITELAEKLNVSRAYFSTVFTKELKMSPKEYLTSLRITNAKKILADSPSLTVSYISESVGFSDTNLFIKAFKKQTGKTPSEYRSCLEI